MDEYVDEKAQKWKDLKLKWSTPSPIKSTLQEKPKSSLNEKQIESESLSDIVNSLQKQLEQKQVTLKEIQSKNLLVDLNEKKQHLDNTITSKKHNIKELKLKQQILQKEIMHVGSCGNIPSDLRKELYKKLTKLKINSNFQKTASNGSAYNFVKPEIVCEVKLLEFQGDKSNDEPIRHLKYEYSNNSLNATGRARSVSILNSNIVNIRSDKKANYEDCGLKQIIRISGIPKKEFKEVNNKDLPKSKVIKKEIFKKESKKGTAIKKFLFWKSNKEKVSDYPSFLCYYLDYSEGRKDPMKKKIYPFNDEKLGSAYFKKLMDENVKKGWDKV